MTTKKDLLNLLTMKFHVLTPLPINEQERGHKISVYGVTVTVPAMMSLIAFSPAAFTSAAKV